ncbi:ABCAD protein, partial [Upupa epops]|nr:ABCAD protein [Upupa epops]
MKQIEELAKGFIETAEKAMALENLWEENSEFSGTCYYCSVKKICFIHIKMDLNEVEEVISRAENLYKQPYFWNLLHSLPRFELNTFHTEDELAAVAQVLEVVQYTLASLKGLPMMPLGQSFYEVVNTALNLTAATVQDMSLGSFQFNLSLGDVLWNPHAVKAKLESRFGFDDAHVERLLSYRAQLTKV